MFNSITDFIDFVGNKLILSVKNLKPTEFFDWINWSAIELQMNKIHYSGIAKNYFKNFTKEIK